MITGKSITILGINGHLGHHAAKAFAAAGWQVTGFGRSNRHPIPNVSFVKGDASSVEDVRAAIGDNTVVFNALNLPYAEWDQGRKEALMQRVIDAMEVGRTMLFPANVYNYAASDRVITPSTPQHPQTPRGEIRQRVEAQLAATARSGRMQVIMLRAGDFFGPESGNDWFDLAILRDAGKGKLSLMGDRGVGHTWAYLPDLARAFTVLADKRDELGAFENFQFAGNFVTPEQMGTAIVAAAPMPLKVGYFPRAILSLMGIINPMMREIAKMTYLWSNPMALRDDRLDALLGRDFGTPFAEAVAATVAPSFARRLMVA